MLTGSHYEFPSLGISVKLGVHVSYFDRLFNGLDTESIDPTERIINLKTFQLRRLMVARALGKIWICFITI